MTEKTGTGIQAHHALPQKYEKFLSRVGVNIHDPENLLWREPNKHRTKTAEQLREWGKYISRHPNATKQEILAERDRIEKKVFGNTKGDL